MQHHLDNLDWYSETGTPYQDNDFDSKFQSRLEISRHENVLCNFKIVRVPQKAKRLQLTSQAWKFAKWRRLVPYPFPHRAQICHFGRFDQEKAIEATKKNCSPHPNNCKLPIPTWFAALQASLVKVAMKQTKNRRLKHTSLGPEQLRA